MEVKQEQDDMVLSNDSGSDVGLPEQATQHEKFNKSSSFESTEDSGCHVGVDQKNMKSVSVTGHPDLVKLDVLSKNTAEEKTSVDKNEDICVIDNIQLRNDSVKQMLPPAVEPVHDINCLTMEAYITISQNSNLIFSHNTDSSVLIHESEGLNQNDKRVHVGNKPYKCDVCGVDFAQNCHLKQHIRVHTGEKPYKCDICGFEFAQCGNLRKHERMHTGEKPHKCDICGLGFTESSNLKKHTRIHSGEKPYACDVCNVKFTENHHLKKHKRLHTGERPYKCDICYLGFTESGSLKKHKRIHTGEKPYKCDICSLGFTESSNLKRHKRIHTGEQSYKCDVCCAAFTQSSNLETHKRIHTGGTYLQK